MPHRSYSLAELRRSLQSGSTLPARFILFLCSCTWGIGFLFMRDATFYENRAFQAFSHMGNRYQWAAAFLTVAILEGWRILDWKSRILWSYFINSGAFGFWTVVTFLRLVNRLELWPVMSTDICICIVSLWVALRTNLTPRDRETA
jgi:hypothetical protein